VAPDGAAALRRMAIEIDRKMAGGLCALCSRARFQDTGSGHEAVSCTSQRYPQHGAPYAASSPGRHPYTTQTRQLDSRTTEVKPRNGTKDVNLDPLDPAYGEAGIAPKCEPEAGAR
jgi:hypothetical protein